MRSGHRVRRVRLRQSRPDRSTARRASGQPARSPTGCPTSSSSRSSSPDLRDRVELEERRRQLPRVLPLPRRPQGLRLARLYGHLQGDHSRDLQLPHGRGRRARFAYDVSEATVTDHAVWWLWPHRLMRYPGRGNFISRIIPVGPERMLETYDSSSRPPNPPRPSSTRFAISTTSFNPKTSVSSRACMRMRTPAFDQGRIVHDPTGLDFRARRAPFPRPRARRASPAHESDVSRETHEDRRAGDRDPAGAVDIDGRHVCRLFGPDGHDAVRHLVGDGVEMTASGSAQPIITSTCMSSRDLPAALKRLSELCRRASKTPVGPPVSHLDIDAHAHFSDPARGAHGRDGTCRRRCHMAVRSQRKPATTWPASSAHSREPRWECSMIGSPSSPVDAAVSDGRPERFGRRRHRYAGDRATAAVSVAMRPPAPSFPSTSPTRLLSWPASPRCATPTADSTSS